MAELVPTPSEPEQGVVEPTPQQDSESSLLVSDIDDITVVARNPRQMDDCQRALISWCERKLLWAQTNRDDLAENLEIAKKNKWGTGGLYRAHARAVKMVTFYEKVKAALEAGYCIVPNFPVELFAIRTNRKHPTRKNVSSIHNVPVHEPEGLPAGEGRYVDDAQLVGRGTYSDETRFVFAKKFIEEIDFPFALAKPAILDATSTAMAAKLFDEMGVLPASSKKRDPVVVGRIIDPRGSTYDKRFVTFLVAWFLDTRTL